MTHGRCYGISRGPAKPDLIEDVLEPEEKASMFAGTARRVYRL
jgi:hypothetical protein